MDIIDWPNSKKGHKRISVFENIASVLGRQVSGTDKVSKLVLSSQRAKSALPEAAPGIFTLGVKDGEKFLHLVTSCAKISTHHELFLLVQGDLQFFLPQDILIAAWGSFTTQDPQVDVISNLPGVRTEPLCGCVVPMAKRLFKIWVQGGSHAMVHDERVSESPACTDVSCTRPCRLRDVRLTLIHGTHNKRDGCHSLYFALRLNPVARNGEDARMQFMADPIIHQLDVAYRRIAALGAGTAPSNRLACSMHLSAREEEITHWVCQGKTNAQIAQILNISVNTVKNHVHRIFDKLGADNRTQAVVKYRGMGASTESNVDGSNP